MGFFKRFKGVWIFGKGEGEDNWSGWAGWIRCGRLC